MLNNKKTKLLNKIQKILSDTKYRKIINFIVVIFLMIIVISIVLVFSLLLVKNTLITKNWVTNNLAHIINNNKHRFYVDSSLNPIEILGVSDVKITNILSVKISWKILAPTFNDPLNPQKINFISINNKSKITDLTDTIVDKAMTAGGFLTYAKITPKFPNTEDNIKIIHSDIETFITNNLWATSAENLNDKKYIILDGENNNPTWNSQNGSWFVGISTKNILIHYSLKLGNFDNQTTLKKYIIPDDEIWNPIGLYFLKK